jgi:hypothetical protein
MKTPAGVRQKRATAVLDKLSAREASSPVVALAAAAATMTRRERARRTRAARTTQTLLVSTHDRRTADASPSSLKEVRGQRRVRLRWGGEGGSGVCVCV